MVGSIPATPVDKIRAIGVRPIDQHLKGLEALGCKFVVEKGYILGTVDQLKGAEINLDVPEHIIKERYKNWKKPEPNYKRGVLAKYAATVQSASKGAVTD